MRDLLAQVCDLQKSWTSKNTPAMKRRGEIIRKEIPHELKYHLPQVSKILGRVGEDLFVEGRDGTGQKTEIPWVRLASIARSASAQNGWYLVYLFEATGRGVYLALAHGSTDFVDGEFKPKQPEQVEKFMSWAREHLKDEIQKFPYFSTRIGLGARRSKLGPAYQDTTLLAKWYPVSGLPETDVLLSDLSLFAEFLKKLYQAEDFGIAPSSPLPEVSAVVQAIKPRGTYKSSGGQGFGLSAEERKVIENHAMEIARHWLEGKKYKVKDVSAHESYDFEAARGDTKLIVEVKGTTSAGEKVVLTANEVLVHRARYPENILIIVHDINLLRDSQPLKAESGTVKIVMPWAISDENLTPLSYVYTVTS